MKEVTINDKVFIINKLSALKQYEILRTLSGIIKGSMEEMLEAWSKLSEAESLKINTLCLSAVQVQMTPTTRAWLIVDGALGENWNQSLGLEEVLALVVESLQVNIGPFLLKQGMDISGFSMIKT